MKIGLATEARRSQRGDTEEEVKEGMNKLFVLFFFLLYLFTSCFNNAFLPTNYIEKNNFRWKKKRQITITGASSHLTNHQVQIGVAYDSDMCSDYSDLRFFNTDKNNLNYWIEDYDLVKAVVWVKISDIPTAGTVIDMYYDNPVAISESDGETTFLFFDDFSGTSLDSLKWNSSTETGTGSINVSGGRVNLNTYDDGGWSKIVSTQSFSFGNIIEFYAMIDEIGWNDGEIGLNNCDNGGDDYMNMYYYWCPGHGFFEQEFHTKNNGTSGIEAIVFNFATWYKIKIFSTGSSAELWRDIAQFIQNTPNSFPKTTETAPIYIRAHSSTLSNLEPQISVDWVRVRKYASPEPSATVGEEIEID